MGDDATHDKGNGSVAGAPVNKLLEVGEVLPEDVKTEILAAAPECVPDLVRVLTNKELHLKDGPGQGWAPIHAAALLRELKPAEAVADMIQVVRELAPEAMLRGRLLYAIRACGEGAVAPVIAAYDAAENADERADFCQILCGLGVKNEAVWDVLRRAFEESVHLGAMAFADYGDPRALPLLSQALDDYEVIEETTSPFDNQVAIHILGAIEGLGGEATPAQKEKLDKVRRLRESNKPMMDAILKNKKRDEEAAARRNLTRNDPCWCGSGKKYKKCHLEADRGK